MATIRSGHPVTRVSATLQLDSTNGSYSPRGAVPGPAVADIELARRVHADQAKQSKCHRNDRVTKPRWHWNDRVGSKDQEMESLEPLLTIQELATYLGVPIATIYGWRYRGEGPPGFRVGRHLRFRRSDVEDWITHQRRPAHTPSR